MEKKFYTSTNWAPWLGVGFAFSTLFFGMISHTGLLAFLVFLSFLPALVVALTLRGYFLLEDYQIKFCYDRPRGRETAYAISLADILQVHRVGKSVSIRFDKNDEINTRLSQAETFVQEIAQKNPRIEILIA
jgi:hypothetical protein